MGPPAAADRSAAPLRAAEAEACQRRVAAALASRGLQAGDRVAFVVDSSADLLCALLGALRVGVVPVPLSPGLRPHERAALLADAEPAWVVASPGELAALVGAPGDPEADLAPVPLARPLHYTSGTTGTPKGVWSGLLDEAAAAALVAEEQELWGIGPDDVTLVCSPLWHSAPLRFATVTLLAGGSVLVLDRFDAGAVLEAAAAAAPTVAFMVPAHLQRLFAAGAPADLAPRLRSFRLLAHAGAPCPEPLKRAALAAFPAGAVWEFYGATEGQFTACAPEEWLARPGTVGRARPGRRLRVDDAGVVWCTPPPYARFTYWRDPVRTAAAWDGDAFTVGDLGRLDADGYLWLDPRRDDLVVTGGVNVYPAEVEAALAGVAGVEEVVVFGVADERWGQRVCAAVVGTARPADVLAAAADRLAPWKRPKEVYVVDPALIPRTPTGKLRRSAMAAALGLEPAGG
jgi:acyl-CoA synthetase (AMP-forming)/AMP-acid ligase II